MSPVGQVAQHAAFSAAPNAERYVDHAEFKSSWVALRSAKRSATLTAWRKRTGTRCQILRTQATANRRHFRLFCTSRSGPTTSPSDSLCSHSSSVIAAPHGTNAGPELALYRLLRRMLR